MPKQQKALDVGYDKMVGTLRLDELNNSLADGWLVVATEYSAGGDILVILEKDTD